MMFAALMGRLKEYLDRNELLILVGKFVFSIRWWLVPMYIGLYIAMILYNIKFFQALWEMCRHYQSITQETALLFIIDLIDIVMVANLLTTSTVGGFSIFVREYDYDSFTRLPRWMHGINSMTLKVKMGVSLSGIAAIQLLTAFMKITEPQGVSWDTILKEIVVLAAFVILTLAFCWFNLLTHTHPEPTPSDKDEPEKVHHEHA